MSPRGTSQRKIVKNYPQMRSELGNGGGGFLGMIPSRGCWFSNEDNDARRCCDFHADSPDSGPINLRKFIPRGGGPTPSHPGFHRVRKGTNGWIVTWGWCVVYQSRSSRALLHVHVGAAGTRPWGLSLVRVRLTRDWLGGHPARLWDWRVQGTPTGLCMFDSGSQKSVYWIHP